MKRVAALSPAPGRIDLFRVDDRVLWHRALKGEPGAARHVSAAPWPLRRLQPPGRPTSSRCSPCSTTASYGTASGMAATWHPWALGGEPVLGPSSADSSPGPDRLDVFTTGVDDSTWHGPRDGAPWVEWGRLHI